MRTYNSLAINNIVTSIVTLESHFNCMDTHPDDQVGIEDDMEFINNEIHKIKKLVGL